MPHRLAQILTFIDAAAGITAAGVITSVLTGLNVSSAGAFLAGLGSFLYMLARAKKLRAEADVIKTYSDPAAFRMLERIKCWNAPNCPTRELFRPSKTEEEV